jgi:hypothetical protein
MAALSGVKGKVTLPAGVAQAALINRWTASLDRQVFDISSFDSGVNERDKLGGPVHLTGTIEGVVDGTQMILIAQMQEEDLVSTAVFLLVVQTGAVLDGQLIFNGALSNTSLDVPKGGVQTFSAAFESTGIIQFQEKTDV